MFDIGWTELVLIGIVALIVIGPKDLPDLFRTLGRFTGRMRGMARDFQRAMDAAADESGVRDVARDVNNLANPAQTGLNKLKDAATKFENWDPLKPGPGPAKPAEAASPDTDEPAPPAAPTIHRQGIAAKAAEAQRLAKAEAQAPAEKPAAKPRKAKAVAETPAEPKPKAPRKPKAPKGEA